MVQSFGSWPSPFAAATLAAGGSRIDGACFVGSEIWWGESVPQEGGRVTVRRATAEGVVHDVLPAPWNARSRVHEYGGGSWTAAEDGTLFFVDGSDQRVYRLSAGGDAEPLTTAGARYGGLALQHGRLLAVREDLRTEPHVRSLVEIPIDGSAGDNDTALHVFTTTTGFVAHPALSPDATRIAWVQWSELRMPWESAQLHVSTVADGHVITVPTRAALQPEWIGNDELVFADDPEGRWNLFRVRLEGSEGLNIVGDAKPIAPADADTGGGLWVLGQRWYRPLDDGRIVAVRTNGTDELTVIESIPGEEPVVATLTVPMNADVSIVDAQGPRVLVTGAGATVTAGLWCIDVDEATIVAVRGGAEVDSDWMPRARPVTFDGPNGPVHAFDFPPTNPEATAPADELPPYVIFVHGGPTAHVSGATTPAIGYYTSRGIGVLDVNYSGSTGYGRAYRERLNGRWGIADVDDVLAAASGLAAAGIADPARLAVRGGSAGGWTVLCALVRGGVFTAGISRYGVGDLRALAADTHDFEKHYTDGLVGPLPEAEQTYIERSPLTHADQIDVPVLLLQGADDAVVPPAQSESIRDALAARNIPHEYLLFPGEGHGFRRAETIVAVAEAELRFLGRVFGFEPQL